MLLGAEFTILLAKAIKACSCCKKCRDISSKGGFQQVVLESMAEINLLAYDFGGKERKRTLGFIMDLTDICLNCDAKSALVYEKGKDYLNKSGSVKRIIRENNIYFIEAYRKVKKN